MAPLGRASHALKAGLAARLACRTQPAPVSTAYLREPTCSVGVCSSLQQPPLPLPSHCANDRLQPTRAPTVPPPASMVLDLKLLFLCLRSVCGGILWRHHWPHCEHVHWVVHRVKWSAMRCRQPVCKYVARGEQRHPALPVHSLILKCAPQVPLGCGLGRCSCCPP